MVNTKIIALPNGYSFERWVGILITTFPEENIPLALEESKWWDWADTLSLLPTFSNAPNPVPTFYPKEDSWRDWVFDLIAVLNS